MTSREALRPESRAVSMTPNRFRAISERSKDAWNRHPHRFLATWYRSGFLHPFYNPQARFIRERIQSQLAAMHRGIPFNFEMNLLRPFSILYWGHVDRIRARVPFLQDAFMALCRMAGALRWWRIRMCYPKSVRKLSLLDLGCGSGNSYESFRSFGLHHFLEYVGIDIAEKNIENCKALYPKGTFAVGDIMDTGFPECAFDTVLVSHVFEHLHPQVLPFALREAWRVARRQVIFNFFCEEDTDRHRIIPKDGLYYWNCLSRKRIKKTLGISDDAIEITDSYWGRRWKRISFLGYPVSCSTWVMTKRPASL